VSDAPIDAEAFRAFERAANSRNAASYHDLFAAVTDRAIAPLLDAARVGNGTRLLDVAAGPGRLAGAAAKRGARASGLDLAPAMVALARSLHPNLDFAEGSADALPFADRSFDALTCAFGLGHFPEPERAVGEFHRVLAPGGMVALAWWDDLARNRINGIFHEVNARLKLAPTDELPAGPPFDRYCDRDRLADLLRSAGFDAVRVEDIAFKHAVKDADALWAMAMGSFARAAPLILAQSDDMQRRIRTEITEAARRYVAPGGLEIPVAILVASGRRP
jgi:SAM-dependent methyltransferase